MFKNFMGEDGFIWFVGVVEDRNDPLKIGRVRVRCLGFHTNSVSQLPTKNLPWAHVMHPTTDPSMQGLGNTPSWLVPGTWVVGFFRDVDQKQQPIIIGSLPGISEHGANNADGFNDPRGIDTVQEDYRGEPMFGPYPGERSSGHDTGESDTSRLGRGMDSEEHNSLIDRRTERLRGDPEPPAEPEDPNDKTGIPTASKPYLFNVSTETEQDLEERGYWEEPHPKGIVADANPYKSGAYPYNHVLETESGHVFEIDDSPDYERLFRQHRSGTFEEIHRNGDMVTKIVGDNYEIVMGSENIVIKGNQNTGQGLNITVEGDVRQLIKGDYILEVEGNYFRKIHNNERTKVGVLVDEWGESIGGNREEEIVGNHSYNINDDIKGRIGGDTIISKEKSSVEVVGGQWKLSTEGKKMDSNPKERGIHIKTSKDYLLDVDGNMSASTITGIVSIKSGSTLNMKSADGMMIYAEDSMTVYTEGSMTQTAEDGDFTITGGSDIQLNP